MAVKSVSFVLETLGVTFRGKGSLACILFSPVPGPWFRSPLEVVNDRAAWRAERRLSLELAALTVGIMLAMLGNESSREFGRRWN